MAISFQCAPLLSYMSQHAHIFDKSFLPRMFKVTKKSAFTFSQLLKYNFAVLEYFYLLLYATSCFYSTTLWRQILYFSLQYVAMDNRAGCKINLED